MNIYFTGAVAQRVPLAEVTNQYDFCNKLYGRNCND